jgi:hypothetical protein
MRARLHISTAATTTATIRKHSNHDARRQDSRSGTYDPETNAFDKYPKRTSWNNVPSTLKVPSDDIMEVYSRPRIVPLAVARGMIGELSVDLVTGYNMNLPEVVSTVVAEVCYRRPKVLVVSPPCTMFSALQVMWNLKKMTPEVKETRMNEALHHLNSSMELCRIQWEGKRGFIFEHPDRATSWAQPSVEAVARLPGVHIIKFDQCRFGLRSPDNTGPLRKSTKFLTNMPSVVDRFNNVRCECQEAHTHIKGRQNGVRISSFAQCYPKPMVTAIVNASEQFVENRIG